jgi:hypothetical protein
MLLHLMIDGWKVTFSNIHEKAIFPGQSSWFIPFKALVPGLAQFTIQQPFTNTPQLILNTIESKHVHLNVGFFPKNPTQVSHVSQFIG